MRHLALPALCLLLAACQPIPHEAPPPGSPGLAACGGNPVLALIGQNVTTLPATGDWQTLRVIGPDTAVTEDYSETRLNVVIDGQGRITGAWCG